MLLNWLGKTVRRQLLFAFCVPLFIALALMEWSQLHDSLSRIKQMATIQAVELVKTTSDSLTERTRTNDLPAIASQLSTTRARIQQERTDIGLSFYQVEELAVFSPDGTTVLAHTDSEQYPPMSAHPDVIGPFFVKGSRASRFVETLVAWEGTRQLEVVAPIWYDGELVGVVYARLDAEPLMTHMDEARLHGAARVSLILLIGFIITLLSSRYLNRIIGRIVQQSHSLGTGKVSLDSVLANHNELGTLAKAIVTADERISLAGRERDEYAQTLQAIMDNSPFGIWFTDPDGKPQLVNATLCEQVGRTHEALLALPHVGDLFDDQVRDEFMAEGGARTAQQRQHTIYAAFPVPHKGRCDFKITRVSLLDEDDFITGFVGIVEDVTEARRLHDQISYQATHDSLTGLLNRAAFEQKLDQVCRTISEGDTSHALIYLDLDQFKVVNDTCGHHAGDELLRQITGLYKQQTRRTESVSEFNGEGLKPAIARLGGDEFAILLYNCLPEDALHVANRLIHTTREFSFSYDKHVFAVGCSVGVVPIRPGNGGSTEVMQQADSACYVAKDKGRGRAHLFEEDDQEVSSRRGAAQWVPRITEALTNNRLIIYAQTIAPVVGTESGDRFEVLVRYLDDDGTTIPPGAFLPACERFSFMPHLDRWIIEHTFMELEQQYGNGAGRSLASASINLSGQTLGEEWLLEFVCRQFASGTILPQQICFEITETAAIANLGAAMNLIDRLRDIGCKFSLDDFGSGLSSFSFLHDLKIDYLKIDGSLIRNITTDPVGREMVAAIHRVGQVMGMQTIGEWVENDEIMEVLREIGIDYAQGYGIGEPQPLLPTQMASPIAQSD